MEGIVSWLSGGGSGGARTLGDVDGDWERVHAERSYAGVIVFNKAHKAKNLEADSRTARLVLVLQERPPWVQTPPPVPTRS